MSTVRDEEELHREGAAGFVAIDIVGRTPWQLFWVRFKRDRVAFVALGFIVLLVLVAIFAGPISSAFGHPPNAQYPNRLDSFGTPTGSARMAGVTSAVPPEPPRPMMPAISARAVMKRAKASAMAVTALPRSPVKTASAPPG